MISCVFLILWYKSAGIRARYLFFIIMDIYSLNKCMVSYSLCCAHKEKINTFQDFIEFKLFTTLFSIHFSLYDLKWNTEHSDEIYYLSFWGTYDDGSIQRNKINQRTGCLHKFYCENYAGNGCITTKSQNVTSVLWSVPV